MKILFDVNVVLDIVGNRLPFYGDSHASLLKAAEIGATILLAVHAYPTLYYLLGQFWYKELLDMNHLQQK